MNPVLLTANPTGVEFTATVVMAGVGIVFGVLLLLIAVFYAFGAIVSKSEKAAKKRAMKKLDKKLEKDNAAATAPAPVEKKSVNNTPAQAYPVVQQGISAEVVAAISAAITMFEGDSSVRICSISRKNTASNRNAWSYAALTENTRPF